nr:hypothetical protein GCM10010200_081890 [Actinomadura rugatobispora]
MDAKAIRNLEVLAVGLYLPPSVDVRTLVAVYQGWERAYHGGADDHPSGMGALACAWVWQEAESGPTN